MEEGVNKLCYVLYEQPNQRKFMAVVDVLIAKIDKNRPCFAVKRAILFHFVLFLALNYITLCKYLINLGKTNKIYFFRILSIALPCRTLFNVFICIF